MHFNAIPITIRFHQSYDVDSNGCWIWNKCKSSGYGRVKVDGKLLNAHRVSFELHHHQITEGLYVCHSCDVKACVNPDHLFIGTAQDNVADRVKKGRSARGVSNVKAKLTEADVLSIRDLCSSGVSRVIIGVAFNVTPSCVGRIERRDTWTHI